MRRSQILSDAEIDELLASVGKMRKTAGASTETRSASSSWAARPGRRCASTRPGASRPSAPRSARSSSAATMTRDGAVRAARREVLRQPAATDVGTVPGLQWLVRFPAGAVVLG